MSRLLFVLLILLLYQAAAAQEITEDNGAFTAAGAGYKVLIPAGRMLSSMEINGVEFAEKEAINPGVSFFNNGAAQAASRNRREGSSVICEVEGYGQVTYRFGADSLEIEVLNTGEVAEDFFMLLSRNVQAVMDSGGKCMPAYSRLEPGEYKWVMGNHAIVSKGQARFWGPFIMCELFQLPTAPGEKCSLTIAPSQVSFADRKLVMETILPALGEDKEDLALDSPAEYQVFQRQTKTRGRLFFSGKVNVPCDRVEYKITGQGINGRKYPSSFKPLRVQDGTFGEYVDGWAGGWYTVEVRAIRDKKTVASQTLEHVGIGEVFVGAGQSNSTNNGQFPIQQTLGMSSTTDGKVWKINDDPMLGHHDNTQGGSYYPALGDALYERLGVPIGIASTGHGATGIVHWLPETDLYAYMMNRIRQLGKNGFRAVLWHQGESDALNPSDVSLINMQRIIETSVYDAGWEFPWFVAKVSYHSAANPRWPNIRRAHQRLWDLGIAQQGPDTDVLTAELRDNTGIHLNREGLKKHGEMWAEILGPWIKEWEKVNP
ncbi:MAG: hypothetical protein IK083_03240 [Abditibacteriota bacterium]|nr:hypothetical protein [Abditibacteriota bacterium]